MQQKDKKYDNWLLCLYNTDYELTSTPTEIDKLTNLHGLN